MTNEEQIKWGSHLPALGACLGVTTGPFVEFGCGHFSTPFLNQYSRATGRAFISYETNPEWAKLFPGTLVVNDYLHAVQSISLTRDWSLVFIDGSPGGKARMELFRECLPLSKFVVVHDYHLENSDAIEPYTIGLKMKHVFNAYEPPTLVASLTSAFPV